MSAVLLEVSRSTLSCTKVTDLGIDFFLPKKIKILLISAIQSFLSFYTGLNSAFYLLSLKSFHEFSQIAHRSDITLCNLG